MKGFNTPYYPCKKNPPMASSTYPPGPVNLPKGLTALTPSYQFRALLAIVAIVLFFLLYFLLVAALAYLTYLALTYPMGSVNKLTILMKLGAIAGSVMLFVFTLKFIFKIRNHQPENRIKLEKKAYPELFGFVDQICRDTGAPKPRFIYADPDVNAYVAYSNMWLSLLLPVRKDLTIGLGLVGCLNMSEFKAVIAHEFGHFAQRSMKIGSYIVSANTIIHDMIFDRDKWDEALERWRASDIRLSAAAWVITPVIWAIRKVLGLFYAFLNIMHSSLSREMEFNADKVAVSAAGSNAIVSALWKLDYGAAHWGSTVNHANLAAQKQLFPKNLYAYYNLAMERNSTLQKEIIGSLPDDPKGGRKYFSGSEASRVSMYASHPPNDMRENSAKTPFIPCETDEQSPWSLFSSDQPLQEEMTGLIFQKYLGKSPSAFTGIAEFEQFIVSESFGRELLEAHHNTFRDRFLHIPSPEEIETVTGHGEANLKAEYAALMAELENLMKPIREIESLMLKVQQLANGVSAEKSFTFNGKTYDKQSLQEGYNELIKQREKIYANDFTGWDTSFCALHLTMAKRAGKERELSDLYAQHAALSNVYLAIVKAKNSIFSELHSLQSRKNVTQVEVDDFASRILQMVAQLNAVLTSLEKINFVPLPNIETVQELKGAIADGGAFPKEAASLMFKNGGLDRIAGALNNATGNCQRLDQKSIASILAFHDGLHKTQGVFD